MVFIGGAVLADVMKDKTQFWLSKQQYHELGMNKLLEMHYGGGPKYVDNCYD